MTPERILLLLVESHHGHPHRYAVEQLLFRIMRNERPTYDDIGALVQGFFTHPLLDTMDLQDVLDWLNTRYGANWMI